MDILLIIPNINATIKLAFLIFLNEKQIYKKYNTMSGIVYYMSDNTLCCNNTMSGINKKISLKIL